MKKVNREGFSGELPEELFEQEEWSVLSKDEVEKGRKRLKFKHPLADKPLWKVLPFLKPLYCCRRDGNEF